MTDPIRAALDKAVAIDQAPTRHIAPEKHVAEIIAAFLRALPDGAVLTLRIQSANTTTKIVRSVRCEVTTRPL